MCTAYSIAHTYRVCTVQCTCTCTSSTDFIHMLQVLYKDDYTQYKQQWRTRHKVYKYQGTVHTKRWCHHSHFHACLFKSLLCPFHQLCSSRVQQRLSEFESVEKCPIKWPETDWSSQIETDVLYTIRHARICDLAALRDNAAACTRST